MIGSTATHAELAPPTVRVSVFGGLRVLVDDVEVELGPVRQRAILALLVAARGEVVPIAEIAEALWGDDAPPSSLNQIHRHVGELRRLLEPGLGPRETSSRLRAAGNGYRLDVTGIDSELERFYALAGPDSALQAARMCAPSPFAGLPPHVRARPSLSGIDRDRRAAICDAAGAPLDDVEAAAMLSIVESIAVEAPLDERVQSRRIRLLARVGRRSEAFAAYETVRAILADELGVDPGHDLRAAHAELVRDETGPVVLPAARVPNFIPPALSTFVDRSELRPLLADVVEPGSDRGAVVVLSGMGGVGKTTLAVQWASELADRYPDGRLHVNLLGYAQGGPLSAEEATKLLLEQLGGDVSTGSAATQSELYRSLLAGRRMIVLIDNARDAEQVRPLLTGEPGCLTIVTSRDRLAGLVVREGARSVPLRQWNADEARRLLVERLGPGRVDREADAVRSIIESCAGLPLALAIAAARSTLQPELSMSDIAGQLTSGPTLDSLSAGETDNLRSTFEWSYRALHPETARLFRRLGAHPGPQMSLESLATLVDRTVASTRAAMNELVSANLALETAPGRFEIHDLLRAYADELLERAEERRQADVALIAHFVLSTREAFMQFGRSPTVEVPFVRPWPESIERFVSMEASTEWYSRERGVLKAMVERASGMGLDVECALIVLDWRPMNQSVESASDTVRYSRLGLEAARRSKDGVLVAELSRDLGSKLSRLGDFEDAERYLRESLAAFVALGDAAGESNAWRNLATSAFRVGDGDRKLEYARAGVEAARRSKDPASIANALVVLAGMIRRLSTREEVIPVFEEALVWSRAANLGYLEVSIGVGLSELAGEAGDWDECRRLALDTRSRLDYGTDITVEAALHVQLIIAGSELGFPDEVGASLVALDELVARNGPLIEELALDLAGVERGRAWLAAQ